MGEASLQYYLSAYETRVRIQNQANEDFGIKGEYFKVPAFYEVMKHPNGKQFLEDSWNVPLDALRNGMVALSDRFIKRYSFFNPSLYEKAIRLRDADKVRFMDKHYNDLYIASYSGTVYRNQVFEALKRCEGFVDSCTLKKEDNPTFDYLSINDEELRDAYYFAVRNYKNLLNVNAITIPFPVTINKRGYPDKQRMKLIGKLKELTTEKLVEMNTNYYENVLKGVTL